MNQKCHKDWWPLSKQTVICFLVIPHSCYRRFLYNLGSQKLYKKYWCGLTTMPVPSSGCTDHCWSPVAMAWDCHFQVCSLQWPAQIPREKRVSVCNWLCQFCPCKEITFDRQWRSRKVPWYCCRKLSYPPHRWSMTAKSTDVSVAPHLHTEKPQRMQKQACTCHSACMHESLQRCLLRDKMLRLW